MQNILIGLSFQKGKILQKGRVWEDDIGVLTNIIHSEEKKKRIGFTRMLRVPVVAKGV